MKEELIKEKKEEKIKENIPKGENNYNKKNKTNKDIKNKFINIPKKIKRKVIKKLITKKILQKMKVFYYHIKNIYNYILYLLLPSSDLYQCRLYNLFLFA